MFKKLKLNWVLFLIGDLKASYKEIWNISIKPKFFEYLKINGHNWDIILRIKFLPFKPIFIQRHSFESWLECYQKV